MIQTTLIRRIHKEFLVSIHHTLWVLMQSKASFWPYFYQEFFGCVEQKKKMFGEEFPCLYYVLMSYFFEKCRASQTKKWYSKNRGLHLILSHDISYQTLPCYSLAFFAQSSLHYRVYDTILHLTVGLIKSVQSTADFAWTPCNALNTTAVTRGSHKREAFANRVMDTHARVPRASLQKKPRVQDQFPRAKKVGKQDTHFSLLSNVLDFSVKSLSDILITFYWVPDIGKV